MNNDRTVINTDEFTFFYKGPFSQFCPSPFVENGIEFGCCEQYMHYHKAMFFGDEQTAKKILNTSIPMMQKTLGREVKNFDNFVWERVREYFVFTGKVVKFRTHKDLCGLLMKTEKTLLVECSPTDETWGIGLAIDNPDIYDKSKWKGFNLLGMSITAVRDYIGSGK